MLGDIFEKSEKKEIASVYYSRIVKDYPLSPLVGDAKGKLVAFEVPVPQPDPKALAWMQAEASAPRPKESFVTKPMALMRNGPDHEKVVASQVRNSNHGAGKQIPRERSGHTDGRRKNAAWSWRLEWDIRKHGGGRDCNAWNRSEWRINSRGGRHRRRGTTHCGGYKHASG